MLSIILGTVLGGALVGPVVSRHLLSFELPEFLSSINTAPEVAVACIGSLYVVAALFNLRIPRTAAPLLPMRGLVELTRDFMECNALLWTDKLGQISLATTTLFWASPATCA